MITSVILQERMHVGWNEEEHIIDKSSKENIYVELVFLDKLKTAYPIIGGIITMERITEEAMLYFSIKMYKDIFSFMSVDESVTQSLSNTLEGRW